MRAPLLLMLMCFFPLFLAPAGAASPLFDDRPDQGFFEDTGESAPPPTRATLENLPRLNVIVDSESAMPIDIRAEAVREAALSYGARGGLAWRTFHIREELSARDAYMDKVFDFRTLLIPAPSGLLIEPPVISEQVNAMIIESTGAEAAVADRVYNINANARLVSAPRNWRQYLERDWGDVAPPPDLLRPNDDKEREQWIKWVREGWDEGVKQADEIFEQDLNELSADYQGMIRYRMLLAQGMVSPPYTLQADRGVTGEGMTMRVGDRVVRITGMPSFIPESNRWKPANR